MEANIEKGKEEVVYKVALELLEQGCDVAFVAKATDISIHRMILLKEKITRYTLQKKAADQGHSEAREELKRLSQFAGPHQTPPEPFTAIRLVSQSEERKRPVTVPTHLGEQRINVETMEWLGTLVSQIKSQYSALEHRSHNTSKLFKQAPQHLKEAKRLEEGIGYFLEAINELKEQLKDSQEPRLTKTKNYYSR